MRYEQDGGVALVTLDDGKVNSLSPDPALLFSKLKGLKPQARRIFTQMI